VAFRQHQMQELRVGFVVGIVFLIKNLPGLKFDFASQMGDVG